MHVTISFLGHLAAIENTVHYIVLKVFVEHVDDEQNYQENVFSLHFVHNRFRPSDKLETTVRAVLFKKNSPRNGVKYDFKQIFRSKGRERIT